MAGDIFAFSMPNVQEKEVKKVEEEIKVEKPSISFDMFGFGNAQQPQFEERVENVDDAEIQEDLDDGEINSQLAVPQSSTSFIVEKLETSFVKDQNSSDKKSQKSTASPVNLGLKELLSSRGSRHGSPASSRKNSSPSLAISHKHSSSSIDKSPPVAQIFVDPEPIPVKESFET